MSPGEQLGQCGLHREPSTFPQEAPTLRVSNLKPFGPLECGKFQSQFSVKLEIQKTQDSYVVGTC